MTIGLVGRKCGMTRIFDDKGSSTPVSVVQLYKNSVAQIKTEENDGYTAVQLAFGSKKNNKLNKPQQGHLSKASLGASKGLIEFRVEDPSEFAVGSEVPITVLSTSKYVDVTGISKGKGFAGVVKRHNFSMQDATHGNSLSHRAHGSTGQNQSPGKVFKGKKMAGQMGNKRVTTQNLSLVKFDEDKSLLFIKGAVPGAVGGDLVIRSSVKIQEETK